MIRSKSGKRTAKNSNQNELIIENDYRPPSERNTMAL
jgi:hypothetical protein